MLYITLTIKGNKPSKNLNYAILSVSCELYIISISYSHDFIIIEKVRITHTHTHKDRHNYIIRVIFTPTIKHVKICISHTLYELYMILKRLLLFIKVLLQN